MRRLFLHDLNQDRAQVAGMNASLSGLRLSVVVLNFRTPQQTARALNCAKAASGDFDLETIVVDNGSNDGSPATIRDLCPFARMIEMPTNVGFAAGMNAGIRQCTGDYVLLLNSDVEACPDSINILVRHMQGCPDVGLAAPVLLNEHGEVSRTLLVQPTLWRVLVPGLGRLRYKQWRRRIGSDMLEVEATEGSAVIVSRGALEKAGPLDEDFFFYHEIVEWCLRIRDAGLRVVVVPQARMTHLRGGSTAKLWLSARIELKRSQYILLRKRFGSLFSRLVAARDLLGEIVDVILYLVCSASCLGRCRRMRTKLAAHWAVLSWMLCGMPGRRSWLYLSRFEGWD